MTVSRRYCRNSADCLVARMSFCKWRDFRACECPHGCGIDRTICHKWSRGECRWQEASRCHHGVHRDSHGRKRKAQDQGSRTNEKASRTAEPVGPAPSSPRTFHTSSPRTFHRKAAVKAMTALLDMEPQADAVLRRLVIALHPDRFKDTPFESVFNQVTQKLNARRDELAGRI